MLKKVYGTKIYHPLSMICAAAYNYGVLDVYQEFYIMIGEGRQCYYEDAFA